MKVNLSDGSFPHQNSATLGGMNIGRHPRNFQWDRYQISDSKYTFFTDMHIKNVVTHKGPAVAWLIEPPSLSWTHYSQTFVLQEYFDYVLSFSSIYLSNFDKKKGLFYPLGGSWIDPENQIPLGKHKEICMIVSQKTGAYGHRMRHEIVRKLSDKYNIDVFGRGYRPFDDKAEILQPYRYAIIVESWIGDHYFSEKIIDALSMGCVPIYHGCPKIGNFLHGEGIISFHSLQELEIILENLAVKEEDYFSRINAIRHNHMTCRAYQCAEDQIFGRYPFLFDKKV